MTTGSLRLRLLAAAGLAVVVALYLSGLVLSQLFIEHVTARVDTELLTHSNQVIANVELDATSGAMQLIVPPADPRFELPNGGLYWQIERPDGVRQRSRSLWETVLTLPADELQDGNVHRHELAGPNGTRLNAVERSVTIGPEGRLTQLRVTVAIDRTEIDEAAAGFRWVLMRSLAYLGLALIAALLVQVHVGLRPLTTLRSALGRVHAGSQSRIEGDFPTEVTPLVDDLNALLDRESRSIERAREQASDLAHGFKTPLTVLSTVARDLKREGRYEAVREIEVQVDMMGRLVKATLARTRIAGARAVGSRSTAVAPVVARVVAALRRVAADRNIAWTVDIPSALSFAGDETDLIELVGNIADNAAKWARSSVSIRAVEADGKLTLNVADDGPGLPPGWELQPPVRGRRLDETRGGTGLGLSIVAKIVEAYAGTLTLSVSPLGGLGIEIALPAARSDGASDQSSSSK